jgi:hypothetical protein
MADSKEDTRDYVAPFNYWLECGIPRKRIWQAIRKGELHIKTTPEGVPRLASTEVEDWFMEQDAIVDTRSLTPEDRHCIAQIPYLRWLRENRPIALACTDSLRCGCSRWLRPIQSPAGCDVASKRSMRRLMKPSQ